jgi:hypothetical protein
MSVQHSWRNGQAFAVHAAGSQFDTLLVSVAVQLQLYRFIFLQKKQRRADYACSKRTLRIYRALVILIKCLVAWWWTY